MLPTPYFDPVLEVASCLRGVPVTGPLPCAAAILGLDDYLPRPCELPPPRTPEQPITRPYAQPTPREVASPTLARSRLARRWITGMGCAEGDSRSMVDLTVLSKTVDDIPEASPNSILAADVWGGHACARAGLPPLSGLAVTDGVTD